MAVGSKCAQIAGQSSLTVKTWKNVNATQYAINTCIFAAAKKENPKRDIALLVDFPCLINVTNAKTI